MPCTPPESTAAAPPPAEYLAGFCWRCQWVRAAVVCTRPDEPLAAECLDCGAPLTADQLSACRPQPVARATPTVLLYVASRPESADPGMARDLAQPSQLRFAPVHTQGLRLQLLRWRGTWQALRRWSAIELWWGALLPMLVFGLAASHQYALGRPVNGMLSWPLFVGGYPLFMLLLWRIWKYSRADHWLRTTHLAWAQELGHAMTLEQVAAAAEFCRFDPAFAARVARLPFDLERDDADAALPFGIAPPDRRQLAADFVQAIQLLRAAPPLAAEAQPTPPPAPTPPPTLILTPPTTTAAAEATPEPERPADPALDLEVQGFATGLAPATLATAAPGIAGQSDGGTEAPTATSPEAASPAATPATPVPAPSLPPVAAAQSIAPRLSRVEDLMYFGRATRQWRQGRQPRPAAGPGERRRRRVSTTVALAVTLALSLLILRNLQRDLELYIVNTEDQVTRLYVDGELKATLDPGWVQHFYVRAAGLHLIELRGIDEIPVWKRAVDLAPGSYALNPSFQTCQFVWHEFKTPNLHTATTLRGDHSRSLVKLPASPDWGPNELLNDTSPPPRTEDGRFTWLELRRKSEMPFVESRPPQPDPRQPDYEFDEDGNLHF